MLRIPINHFEGNYTCDADTLAQLRDEDRVVLRYVDNPNGSIDDIAGICNAGRQRRRPHAPSRAGLGPAARLRRRPVLLGALLRAAGARRAWPDAGARGSSGSRSVGRWARPTSGGGPELSAQLRVRGIFACWSTEALTPTVRHAE